LSYDYTATSLGGSGVLGLLWLVSLFICSQGASNVSYNIARATIKEM
jgi:hypothetical protein